MSGEGGITPATPEYLLGLRQLCDQKRLLLFLDGVQDGHFRTGQFKSFQRILEGGGQASGASAASSEARLAFLPDGISMAKALGGGFPMGAFWVREEAHGVKLADVLGPGTHASTFGGTPLGCAVALKVLEVIQRDRLSDNARRSANLSEPDCCWRSARSVVKSVAGLG